MIHQIKTPFFVCFLVILFSCFNQAKVFGQCIGINEILINASGDCDGNSSIPGCLEGTSEFIELYNNCDTDQDIGCFVYCTNDFCVTIPAGTILTAYTTLVLGSPNSSGIDVTAPNFIDIFTCNCEYIDPSVANPFDALGIFTNQEDQVALFDDSGIPVSGIVWNGGVPFRMALQQTMILTFHLLLAVEQQQSQCLI